MDNAPKKDQPKFIEKMIDKVEEALLQPANSSKPSKVGKPSQQQPPQSQPLAQKMQQENEVNEVALPKGTTITLPDGKSFETQTVSKLSKAGPA